MLTIAVDNAYGFDEPTQQTVYTHEPAGPSMAGPSTIPLPLLPFQQPSHLPATFAGPRFTSFPVPTTSWRKCLFYLRTGRDCLPTLLAPSPPSVSYPDAGNYSSGSYNQPLAAPELRGEWPYQTPVGKGKARATAQLPSPYPQSSGNPSEQTSS